MTAPEPSYRTISLTQGYEAIVDAADFAYLSAFRWHALPSLRKKDGTIRTVYPSTCDPKDSSRRETMARILLGLSGSDICADHVNGNGLDNRRANIRVASWSQNQGNTRRRIGVSGYRGVRPDNGRWQARIRADNKMRNLGCYGSPEEAAKAYDSAALAKFGEFATLNFPRSQ